MPSHALRLLTLATVAAALVACGDTDTLKGKVVGGPDGDDPTNPDGPGGGAAGPTCTEKPEGRSYLGFDGKPIEADRINENVGLNRAR